MQRNPVRLGEMNIVTDEMVLTLVGQHIEKAFYKIYLPFKNRITMGFINQQNYRYLCDGLTYESSDLEVLETVLNAYNEKTGHIDAIIKGNKHYGFQHKVELPGNQIIFNLDVYMTADGKQLVTADAMQIKDTSGLPPGLHLNLQSPSLDVPQRIEIPLKYILNGLPTLSGTHMVYLHALQINDKETFVYYGKTKRGWMKRYIEHVKLAMKGSSREFPGLYGNAIKNRYNQLFGKPLDPSGQVYTGSYHVVCVAGLNGADANEVERYLIKKHSLSNAQGLNMV